ncbi:hypothetical protein FisN_19Lh313 [Fistulifera solaris]|uniref:Uncharacterized protein n=1 Tax=Fistulifera solaris TaxID=1519565 RepID=A0A1Z5K7T9_FISSO|nr:hypothetical protein FisN_19Lh313 [Fistulifera solaris]|eukprot:GAX22245.1 hypothetical protein FisN_19Lh313 [Fistulifera solaris]
MDSFSCNLLIESKKHVEFLEKLHRIGVLTTPYRQKSADRYLDCWLPLLADIHRNHASCMLVPPPDVAWIFHCHRLAPGPYRKYLLQKYQDNSIEEICSPFLFQVEEDTTKEAVETRVEWNLRFPGEPFFLNLKDPSIDMPITESFCDMDGFHLIASVTEQNKFLWQVSDRKFKHDTFLQNAVERYQKFLLLSKSFHRGRGNDSMIVPTYDIDLMWHTHILYSIARYEADCIRIRGSFMNHDDSLNDRSSGSDLEMAFQQTKEAWQELYKEPYINSSDVALYRGEPPGEYYCLKFTCCDPNEDLLTETSAVDTQTPRPLEVFRDLPWVNAQFGLIPGEMAKAFIAVTRCGVHLKKDGYVFGKTSLGEGYFSLCTREAYLILLQKLKVNVRIATRKLHEHDMDTCRLCFRKPTAVEAIVHDQLVEVLDMLRACQNFAWVQYNATGPYKRLCVGVPATTRIVEPFPLNCVLNDSKSTGGYTLGDVCDAAGCSGYIKETCKPAQVDSNRALPNVRGRRRDGGWGFVIGAGDGGCACGGCGCGGGGCGGC